MGLVHIKGNTWCVESATTVPIYKLSEHEIVLLDSGYAVPDRAAFDKLFAAEGLRVAAVIGTHSHIDHNGNHAYFQKKDGALIVLQNLEAAIAYDLQMVRTAYFTATPEEIGQYFSSVVVRADRTFTKDDMAVKVCGVSFGLLPLPGHTPGHTGIITPDNVLYVGDTLMDEATMAAAKMPSSMSWADDLESKRRLRDVTCDRYVLAHRGVFDDIRDLIDKNIADRMRHADEIAAALETPMTISELEGALWTSCCLHTKRAPHIVMFRRSLRCGLDYLTGTDRVNILFEDGVTRYVRA